MLNINAALNIQRVVGVTAAVQQVQSAFRNSGIDVNVRVPTGSTRALDEVNAKVNLLQANLRSAQQAAGGLGGTFGGIDAGTRSASRGLTALGGAVSSANASLREVRRQALEGATAMEQFGTQVGLSLRRFGAFTLAAGTFITLTRGIRQGVADALEFERSMIKLSQVSGDTGDKIKGVQAEVTRLAVSLGVSSRDLAEASVTFRQAGLSIEQTRIALEAVAKASLAPNFGSMKEVVEGSVATLRQFGRDARELEGILGSLNAVAGEFAVEGSDLVKVIQRAGGAFKQAGGDVNELVSLFTAVRSTTRESAEEIATGLRTIFTRIQRTDTVESLKNLQINLRYLRNEAQGIGRIDLEDQFVGAFEAFKRLSEGLSQIRPSDPRYSAIVEELGGYRQISRVIPLIQQFGQAQQALNVAQSGQISLQIAAEKSQEGLLQKTAKVREEYGQFFRTLAGSEAFKQFADNALSLASGLAKVLEYARPLLPLLTTIAAVNIGQGIAGFTTRVTNQVLYGRASTQTPVPRARGGHVPGSGSGDRTHMLLEPEEFVVRRDVAQREGHAKMQAFNEGRLSLGGSSPMRPSPHNRYADGGLARLRPGEHMTAQDIYAAIHFGRGRSPGHSYLGEGRKHSLRLARSAFGSGLAEQFIPKDSKFLGSGIVGLAFQTPAGDVIRVQSGSSHRQAKEIRPKISYGLLAAKRPDDPDILQATDQLSIRRPGGYGRVILQRLPFAEDVGEDEGAKAASQLQVNLAKRGLYFQDSHAGNIGLVGGRYVVRDPGAVVPTPQKLLEKTGLLSGEVSSGAKTVRLRRRKLAGGGVVPQGKLLASVLRQYDAIGRKFNLPLQTFLDTDKIQFSREFPEGVLGRAGGPGGNNIQLNLNNFEKTGPGRQLRLVAAHELGHVIDSYGGGFDYESAAEGHEKIVSRLLRSARKKYGISPTDEAYYLSRREVTADALSGVFTGTIRSPGSNKLFRTSAIPQFEMVRQELLRAIADHGKFNPYVREGFLSRKRLANGGLTGVVPGQGNTDSVPAQLPAGSFVIRKDSVRKIGQANLARMTTSTSSGKRGGVNALLTPGEYVFGPDDVSRLGLPALHRMNAAGDASLARRYAGGGVVRLANGSDGPVPVPLTSLPAKEFPDFYKAMGEEIARLAALGKAVSNVTGAFVKFGKDGPVLQGVIQSADELKKAMKAYEKGLKLEPIKEGGGAAFKSRASKFDAPLTPEQLAFANKPNISPILARISTSAREHKYFRTLHDIDPEKAETSLSRGLQAAVIGFKPETIKPKPGETPEQAEAKAFASFANKAVYQNQLLSESQRAQKKLAEGKAVNVSAVGGEDQKLSVHTPDRQLRPDQIAQAKEENARLARRTIAQRIADKDTPAFEVAAGEGDARKSRFVLPGFSVERQVSAEESKSLLKYTTNSKAINTFLRTGQALNPKAPEDAERVGSVASLGRLPGGVTLFRGIPPADFKRNYGGDEVKPGQSLQDAGAQSFTLSEKIARKFAGELGTVLKYVTSPGDRGYFVNKPRHYVNHDEREVILPPGTGFNVAGQNKEDGRRVLQLQRTTGVRPADSPIIASPHNASVQTSGAVSALAVAAQAASSQSVRPPLTLAPPAGGTPPPPKPPAPPAATPPPPDDNENVVRRGLATLSLRDLPAAAKAAGLTVAAFNDLVSQIRELAKAYGRSASVQSGLTQVAVEFKNQSARVLGLVPRGNQLDVGPLAADRARLVQSRILNQQSGEQPFLAQESRQAQAERASERARKYPYGANTFLYGGLLPKETVPFAKEELLPRGPIPFQDPGRPTPFQVLPVGVGAQQFDRDIPRDRLVTGYNVLPPAVQSLAQREAARARAEQQTQAANDAVRAGRRTNVFGTADPLQVRAQLLDLKRAGASVDELRTVLTQAQGVLDPRQFAGVERTLLGRGATSTIPPALDRQNQQAVFLRDESGNGLIDQRARNRANSVITSLGGQSVVSDATRGVTLANADAQQASRLARELASAQQRLLQSVYGNISSAEAKKLAEEAVTRALSGEERVILNSRGRVLGTQSLVATAGAAGVQARGADGVTLAGLAASGFADRAGNFARNTANAVAQSRVGRLVGGGRDLLNRAGDSFQRSGAYTGFLFGLPYLGETIRGSGGDVNAAIARGETGRDPRGAFTRSQGLAGAAQSAVLGATIGSAVGSVIPGLGTGAGLIIGGVVGGIAGYTNALKDAEKDIRQVKINDALTQFADNIQTLAQAGSAAIPGVSDSARRRLREYVTEAESKAQSESGGDTTAFFRLRNRNLRQDVGPLLPGFVQTLNKQAEDLGRNNVNSPTRGLSAELERGRGGLNADLLRLIAELRNVPLTQVTEDFRKVIEQSQRATRNEQQAQQARGGEERNINAFGRLLLAVQSAADSLQPLQVRAQALTNAFEGTIASLRVDFGTSALANLGRPGGAEAPLGILRRLGGDQGSRLAEVGSVASQISQVLPYILAQVAASNPNGEDAFGTRVRAGLTNALGGNAAVNADPQRGGAINTVISQLNDLSRNGGLDTVYRELRVDATRLSERLIAPFAEPLRERGGQIVRLLEENANAFSSRLADLAGRVQQVGEIFDRAATTRVSLTRTRAEFAGEANFSSRTAVDRLPLSVLTADFRSRQERLTGLAGNRANDPALLGQLLGETNARVDQSARRQQQVGQQTGGRGPAFEAAARELIGLQTQAANLQNALRNLADASTRNAVLQDRLSRIQEDRRSRLGYAERFLTSDTNGRLEANRGVGLLVQAFRQGSFAGLSGDEQRLAIESGRSLGNVRAPLFDGANVQDVVDRLVRNTFPGFVDLPQGAQREEGQLQQQILANLATAEQAQRELASRMGDVIDRLDVNLRQQQEQFFNRLTQIMAQDRVVSLENRRAELSTDQGRLQQRLTQRSELAGLGITTTPRLSAARNNLEQFRNFFEAQRTIDDSNRVQERVQNTGFLQGGLRRAFSGVATNQLFSGGRFDPANGGGRDALQRLFDNNDEFRGLTSRQITSIITRTESLVANAPGLGGARSSPNAFADFVRPQLLQALTQELGGGANTELGAVYNRRNRASTSLRDIGVDTNALLATARTNQGGERILQAIQAFDATANQIETVPVRLQAVNEQLSQIAEQLARTRAQLGGAAPIQNAAGGLIPEFRHFGGGVGRGTSRDTLVRAEPGEFIVRRESARGNERLLDAINSARGPVQHLFGGGLTEALTLPLDFYQSALNPRDVLRANNPTAQLGNVALQQQVNQLTGPQRAIYNQLLRQLGPERALAEAVGRTAGFTGQTTTSGLSQATLRRFGIPEPALNPFTGTTTSGGLSQATLQRFGLSGAGGAATPTSSPAQSGSLLQRLFGAGSATPAVAPAAAPAVATAGPAAPGLLSSLRGGFGNALTSARGSLTLANLRALGSGATAAPGALARSVGPGLAIEAATRIPNVLDNLTTPDEVLQERGQGRGLFQTLSGQSPLADRLIPFNDDSDVSRFVRANPVTNFFANSLGQANPAYQALSLTERVGRSLGSLGERGYNYLFNDGEFTSTADREVLAARRERNEAIQAATSARQERLQSVVAYARAFVNENQERLDATDYQATPLFGFRGLSQRYEQILGRPWHPPVAAAEVAAGRTEPSLAFGNELIGRTVGTSRPFVAGMERAAEVLTRLHLSREVVERADQVDDERADENILALRARTTDPRGFAFRQNSLAVIDAVRRRFRQEDLAEENVGFELNDAAQLYPRLFESATGNNFETSRLGRVDIGRLAERGLTLEAQQAFELSASATAEQREFVTRLRAAQAGLILAQMRSRGYGDADGPNAAALLNPGWARVLQQYIALIPEGALPLGLRGHAELARARQGELEQASGEAFYQQLFVGGGFSRQQAEAARQRLSGEGLLTRIRAGGAEENQLLGGANFDYPNDPLGDIKRDIRSRQANLLQEQGLINSGNPYRDVAETEGGLSTNRLLRKSATLLANQFLTPRELSLENFLTSARLNLQDVPENYDASDLAAYARRLVAALDNGLFTPRRIPQADLNARAAQELAGGGLVHFEGGGRVGTSPIGFGSGSPNPNVFRPRGTDTVPAMLRPGSFVVNRESSRTHAAILNGMRTLGGGLQAAQAGGSVAAMLTPGEVVVPPEEVEKNISMLHAINRSRGGPVYAALGGLFGDAFGRNQANNFVALANQQRRRQAADPFSPAGLQAAGDAARNAAAAQRARLREQQAIDEAAINQPLGDVEDYLPQRRDENGFPLPPNEGDYEQALRTRQLAQLSRQRAQARLARRAAEDAAGPGFDANFAEDAASRARLSTFTEGSVSNLRQRQLEAQAGNPLAAFGLGRADAGGQASVNLGVLGGQQRFRDQFFQRDFFAQRLLQRAQGPQQAPLPRVFADGGAVTGPGSADSVLGLLAPGEYVLPRTAVLGMGGLANVERVRRYAEGGVVGGPQYFATGGQANQTGGFGGDLSAAFRQFGAGVDRVSAALAGFGNASNSLGTALDRFGTNSTRLATALEKFPSNLSVSHNGTVQVVVNGAEALNRMEPAMKEYVDGAIASKVNEVFKNYLPELGVNLE